MPPGGDDGGSHHQGRRAAQAASACARRCSARCMRGRSRRSRRRGASCISPSTPRARRPPADRAALADFCARRGLEPLKPGAKHHRLALGGATLRWEQHSEFTTYTWELPAPAGAPFHPAASALAAPMAALPQPGPVLVALDLHLMAGRREQQSPSSSCSTAPAWRWPRTRKATRCFATDFQVDAGGFVRILVHRPRARARARRRAGAAHHRARDLSHAGAARPAGGAAACALDQPHRDSGSPKSPRRCGAPRSSSTITACSTN